MTKPMIRLHNLETNEIVDREMNDEEFAKYQQQQIEYEKRELAKSEAEAAKAALLAKLGITADEAKLLLS